MLSVECGLMEQLKCLSLVSGTHHLGSFIDFWRKQPFTVGTSIFAYCWIIEIGESTAAHISRIIITSRMISCQTPIVCNSISWAYSPSVIVSSLTFFLNIIVVPLQKWVLRSWSHSWRIWFIPQHLSTLIWHQASFLQISIILDILIAFLIEQFISLLKCPFLILQKCLLGSLFVVFRDKNTRTKSEGPKVFLLLNPIVSEFILLLFKFDSRLVFLKSLGNHLILIPKFSLIIFVFLFLNHCPWRLKSLKRVDSFNWYFVEIRVILSLISWVNYTPIQLFVNYLGFRLGVVDANLIISTLVLHLARVHFSAHVGREVFFKGLLIYFGHIISRLRFFLAMLRNLKPRIGVSIYSAFIWLYC